MGDRILCAAVWVDDGIARPHQPTPTGVVVCGWRHSQCIEAAQALAVGSDEQRSGRNQGFLTSAGLYVDREEGMRIARAAGQIITQRRGSSRILFSEDLY